MGAIVSKEIVEDLGSGPEYSPRLESLMRNAREASDLLKALSHESRLLVLCLLAEKERSVGELEEILSLRQPTVSQQLARLRFDDLVTTRRDGKTIYYSIANEDVRRLIEVIYDIFCESRRTEKPGG
ncbi:MAG: helix-turn-helix transcriptional regulator [Rhizobiales bacterium]|nr:helix-turn-helix transcriptional regulator [Hyphomicrobiales bacterium]